MTQFKQILKQLLTEQAKLSYNVIQELLILLDSLNNDDLKRELAEIRNRISYEDEQKRLITIAEDVVYQYTGKKGLTSRTARDIAEQLVDLSDITSVYFDGRDLDDVIVQYRITNKRVIPLIKELVDSCDQFAEKASRLDVKCVNLSTGKIKDQLEISNVFNDDIEILWNRIKGVAFSFNLEYNYIVHIIDWAIRNKVQHEQN